MPYKREMNTRVLVIASSATWMEGETIRQLEVTAGWSGMRSVVGLPDAQPGKGSPSGAAFLSDIIYPTLVGTDGGCGMAFHVTSLSAKKATVKDLTEKLNGLDMPWDGDHTAWLGDIRTAFDQSLGTPGLGNHFIELQQVVEIFDQDQFNAIGMDETTLHMMVHSGSRGLGDDILREYAAQHGADGVPISSDVGQHYIARADQAIAWAEANRRLCAHRVTTALRTQSKQLLDICHNSVTEALVDGCQCWLHRKGAAPADKGPVIIPGSRGDLSFIVLPIGDQTSNLWSLAHGAGRKISRGDAQGKLANFYRNKDVRKNKWGGQLVCGDKALLWEEAPECYKPISSVIKDLVDFGLIKIVASLRPVVTFKTSQITEKAFHNDRKSWKRERSEARNHKNKQSW